MLSRKVALSCILVIFLAVFGPKVFHYHSADPVGDPVHGRPTSDGSDGAPPRLVVGVLSGRDRRPQRDVIRDTWWRQLEAAGARGVFVVGDSDCPLADRCRLDQHSCERWRPPASAVGSRQSLLLTAGTARRPAAVGITFAVLRAVVARSVTVTSHHQHQLGDVLLESADGQPAAEAVVPMTSDATSVTSDAPPMTSDTPPVTSDATPMTLEATQVMSVPLSPLLVLPAGFMGRLRLRDKVQAQAVDCEQTEVPPPADLHVTALLTADGRHVQPGLEPLCWPVELVYTVHEEAGPATEEDDCLRPDLDVTTRAVAEEAETHGDILLTPGPDVYRRLPDKLLDFFAWVAAETSAEWVIKCDDDVVLDVPRILQDLPPVTEGGVWWGQFRYNWAVDRYGKWAELQYQADVYPPFACGTASLLSADVVRWLADNQRELTRFQGEDVSLGLWLAGRRVRRVPDAGWACGAEDGGRYSRGELSPAALRSVWHCLNSTGSLQSCGGDSNY